MRRRLVIAGLIALAVLAGFAGGVIAQSESSTTSAPPTVATAAVPAPDPTTTAAEARQAEPPADFGERVSAAAQRGPEYPPECGNFGSWVSALAQGRQCTPPPPEELEED